MAKKPDGKKGKKGKGRGGGGNAAKPVDLEAFRLRKERREQRKKNRANHKKGPDPFRQMWFDDNVPAGGQGGKMNNYRSPQNPRLTPSEHLAAAERAAQQSAWETVTRHTGAIHGNLMAPSAIRARSQELFRLAKANQALRGIETRVATLTAPTSDGDVDETYPEVKELKAEINKYLRFENTPPAVIAGLQKNLNLLHLMHVKCVLFRAPRPVRGQYNEEFLRQVAGPVRTLGSYADPSDPSRVEAEKLFAEFLNSCPPAKTLFEELNAGTRADEAPDSDPDSDSDTPALTPTPQSQILTAADATAETPVHAHTATPATAPKSRPRKKTSTPVEA